MIKYVTKPTDSCFALHCPTLFNSFYFPSFPGVPASPQSVTILTDTFTSTSVNISWTESSSPCVTGYRYNVSSAAIEDNIIMEFNSTDSTVVIEGLVPSDDQYCVVVTATDTANRNSSDSDPACFIFNGE